MVNSRSITVHLFLLIWFSIFISTSALATTYYVDATNGQDNNSGTSDTAAWKTIAKVNASRFVPGDLIQFKRGETWREMLTVPTSGRAGSVITFGAYGAGPNPIISGSDLITAGWTKDSSLIWKATVTTQPNIVYFNGTRGIPVAAKANIAAEFNWFWASNVLYVRSPSDIDPSISYTTPGIEVGARQSALKTNDQSYVTIDGLTLRDGNRTAYSTVVTGFNSAAGITFQNCTIERGVSSGIYFSAGVTATSYSLNSCTIQNNGGWGIFTDTVFSGGTISNNVITGNGWRTITDSQQYDGIAGRLGNLDIFGNTIYFNNTDACYITLGCHGIYNTVADSTVVNIHNNEIYGHQNGSAIKSRSSANVYRNLLYNNYGAGVYISDNGNTNVNAKIYYNSIYNNNISNAFSGILEDSKGAGSLNIIAENNTVYNNANTTQQEVKIADDLTALTLKNNILFASSTRRTFGAPLQTGTVDIDNNLHWRLDGNPSINYNGNVQTWAQWQALGYDTHGVNANALLINESGKNFRLQSSSPAINAGTNVELTTDFLGNPIVGLPDLGAYEWYPLLSPPLNLQITVVTN